MKKVAKLIYVSFMTRVVVPEDATEEDILRAAKPKFIQKVNEELSENLEEILDDEECPAEDDEPITGGAVLIPVKDRGQDYWETLSPDCDDAIEIVARQLESGETTPKDFFRKIREFEVDFYPEADITKEVINKAIDFVVENGVEEKEAVHIYQQVQREGMFDKYQEKYPNAVIRFYVNEYDGRDTHIWDFVETYDEAKSQFDEHINDLGEGASDLHLYKALVIIKDIKGGSEVEIIHDEVINSHPIDF